MTDNRFGVSATAAGSPPPVVLVFSGHDPSGGAGQIADTQALRAARCHPAVVVTALTEQDTGNAHAVDAVEPAWIRHQAEPVLADLPIAAIKVGLLPSAALVRTVAALIRQLPDCPCVVDPLATITTATPIAARMNCPIMSRS